MAESVIVERKKFVRSLQYKYWKSVIDLRRCMECKKHQGKIYLLYDIIPEEPPLHPNCRCSVQRLEAKTAGTATKIGLRGRLASKNFSSAIWILYIWILYN